MRHSATPPPTELSPPALPLVGRERALARLLRLVDPEAADRVAVIRGVGGVGKTRLAARVAADAERQGWQIARGRAFSVEGSLPYGVFSDALLPLLDSMGIDRLRVLSRGSEADFAVLFPALRLGPPPGERDSEEFISRLYWNFAAFLSELGREQSLLLVFEDLHWADEASLRLLHFLARHTGPEVRYLATASDDDRHESRSWIRAERSLLGLSDTRVVRLDPLGPGDTLDCISIAFETEPAVVGDFVRRLWDWTHGNPWLIRETLSMLVQTGRLHRRDGVWLGWESPLDDLPPSIRDTVRRRVDTLPQNDRRILETLAVLAGRATSELLGRVLEISADERLDALDGVVRSGMVTEGTSETGVPSWEIRHPIVRRTVVDDLSAARQARIHGRIGRALTELQGSERRLFPHQIGRHLAGSDRVEDRRRAVVHLVDAGRNGLERYAVREAVDALESALRLDDALRRTSESAPLSPDDRAEVLGLLARAHRRAGRFGEAIRLGREALAGTPALDPRARGSRLAELGATLVRAGRAREAVEALSDAVIAVSESGDPFELARVRLSLAAAWQELGRADDSRREIAAALTLAQGDDALLGEAHRALGSLQLWIGPAIEAERHLSTALELAEASGNRELRFECALGLAGLHGSSGNAERGAPWLDLAAEIAHALNSPVLRLRVDEQRLERAYDAGRWDTAIAIGEQAIAISRELGERPLLPRLLVWTSAIHLGRGDRGRARELVDEACELAGMGTDQPSDIHTFVPACIGLAHYHLVSREWEEAIQVAERGLAVAEGTGYVLWTLHRLLPILAEAHLWLDDAAGAEAVAARMREHSARTDHPLGALLADACDALVVWQRGDAERGAEMMRSAADALEEVPLVPLAVRIRRQMAGRLAEIGARNDSVRELRRVHDAFLRMGLERELEKTRIQFREVGARPPSRSPSTPEGLTARELEIARTVAAGRSNKAAGKELGISARTVSTHLTRIYRKLGIDSRDALDSALGPRP